MEIRDHRLEGATRIESPNFDERPQRASADPEIELIVVHCISLPAGHYGGRYVEALFCDRLDCRAHNDFYDLDGVRVSSHLFIRRTGEIEQYVDFDRRAWHAGESSFRGRSRCNDFSVGIELEGTDKNRYRDVQYEVLIEVCKALQRTYDIPADHIVGHSDIAPGRKTDPGPMFDWNRLLSAMGSKL